MSRAYLSLFLGAIGRLLDEVQIVKRAHAHDVDPPYLRSVGGHILLI